MENIVQLAEYRKRRQPTPETGSQYFCTRCDSGEFRLNALGVVHCAHCGARMRNLRVTASSSQEADR